MVPHFGLPSPSDLLMAAYEIVKTKVFGLSSEEDQRMQELVQSVQKQLQELENTYAERARANPPQISAEAPDSADEVESVASETLSSLSSLSRSPSVQSAFSELEELKVEVQKETKLSWKMLNKYLAKAERIQGALEKLIAKLEKSTPNENVIEMKALLKELKDTKLLDGIQESLLALTKLTQAEAIPELEGDLDTLMDSLEMLYAEAHNLQAELEGVEFSGDESDIVKDREKIDKLKGALADSISHASSREADAANAFQESSALPAEKLQKSVESYEMIKKELQAKVSECRSKFTEYKASLESRKQFKLARSGFQSRPLDAESSRVQRTVRKSTTVSPLKEEPVAKAARKAPTPVSKLMHERADKDTKLVTQFVNYLMNDKENNRQFAHPKLSDDEWKHLQRKFADFLKSHPGELPKDAIAHFFANNQSRIITALKKSMGS